VFQLYPCVKIERRTCCETIIWVSLQKKRAAYKITRIESFVLPHMGSIISTPQHWSWSLKSRKFCC